MINNKQIVMGYLSSSNFMAITFRISGILKLRTYTKNSPYFKSDGFL